MAIVTRILLDHILVQFAHGAAHQLNKPGEIEGAQFAEIEYLVDDATGDVVGRTNNPKNGQAQPLDPAKIADVLGAQFATVAAQLADTKQQLAEAEGAAKAAAEKAAAELAEVRQAANAALQEAAGAAEKAARDIAERDATIAHLTAAHDDFSARNAAAIAALSAPAKA